MGRRATARHIASNAARRMFRRSISATDAAPTAISARPDTRSAWNAASRCSGVSFFEIIEQRGQPARHAGRKYYGGGDDRAGERAAPHLVHSRDPPTGTLFQQKVRHAP